MSDSSGIVVSYPIVGTPEYVKEVAAKASALVTDILGHGDIWVAGDHKWGGGVTRMIKYRVLALKEIDTFYNQLQAAERSTPHG